MLDAGITAESAGQPEQTDAVTGSSAGAPLTRASGHASGPMDAQDSKGGSANARVQTAESD